MPLATLRLAGSPSPTDCAWSFPRSTRTSVLSAGEWRLRPMAISRWAGLAADWNHASTGLSNRVTGET